MTSDAVKNAIGATGGAISAACLVPQLWKLWRTRSARDLSYSFLVLYIVGLSMDLTYLILEQATVVSICMMVDVGFGVLILAAKVFLDHWGPHSPRAVAQAAQKEASGSEDEPSDKQLTPCSSCASLGTDIV